MRNFPQDRLVIVERLAGSDFRISEKVSVPKDGIVLYLVDVRSMGARPESRWRELLSSDELDRASRFHFERDRQSYSVTRGVLRALLASSLEVRPQELTFQYSDKGKPRLASPYSRSLAFNISHSGDFALLGFAGTGNIGVDIEKIRDDFDSAAIARRFFSAREQHQLSSLPAEQQHPAFFRCWTRKEAFIKALGEGLSHPLTQFDVSLDRSGPISLTTRPDPTEADRWWLQSVEVGGEYAAAFAVSSR